MLLVGPARAREGNTHDSSNGNGRTYQHTDLDHKRPCSFLFRRRNHCTSRPGCGDPCALLVWRNRCAHGRRGSTLLLLRRSIWSRWRLIPAWGLSCVRRRRVIVRRHRRRRHAARLLTRSCLLREHWHGNSNGHSKESHQADRDLPSKQMGRAPEGASTNTPIPEHLIPNQNRLRCTFRLAGL